MRQASSHLTVKRKWTVLTNWRVLPPVKLTNAPKLHRNSFQRHIWTAKAWLYFSKMYPNLNCQLHYIYLTCKQTLKRRLNKPHIRWQPSNLLHKYSLICSLERAFPCFCAQFIAFHSSCCILWTRWRNKAASFQTKALLWDANVNQIPQTQVFFCQTVIQIP